MTITIGPHNAMVQGTPEVIRSPEKFPVLESIGYTVVAIADLTILNTNPRARHPDPPLSWLADSKQFDAVVSGPDTRVVTGVHPRPPIGPVYRNGDTDTEGDGRSEQRGTVAVLEDRSIIMGRSEGCSARALRDRFGRLGSPLYAALGGGALLIENGRFVDPMDLIAVQRFDDGEGGLKALTMKHGVHAMMGIRLGRAYAAWCHGRSARDIRYDFHTAGFSTLIKYAHGSSVFYDDSVERLNGQNSTGFGLKRSY